MDKDKERERRLQELAEKKKKLDDYRNKNKAGAAANPVKPADIDKAKTFDDMINLVGKISGQPSTSKAATSSPAPSKESKPEPTTTNHQAQPQPVVTAQSSSTAPRRKLHKLSVQSSVAVQDIPPKELEVYSKATQTTSTAEFPEEISTTPKGEITHAESSLLAHKKSPEEAASSNAETANATETKPVDLSPADKEKIVQSPDFVDFFAKSSKVIERALYVSSKYDIAVDYTEADENANNGADNMKEVILQTKLFDERWSKHRAVTDVGWSTKHPDLIVASYSANEQGTNDPDGLVLVWSVQNALQRPEFRFHCQSPVMSSFFDKFSPTIIVGGTYSGQIVLWDTRARATPVQHTPLSSVGHTHPVYCMEIVGTKNAHNLVSVSTDGRLCVWSLDNLLQPIEVLELHNRQSRPAVTATAPVAVTSMAFPEGEVNGFFVGSEEGAVYEAYRHGSKSGVYERFDGHHGPVTGLDFHPASGPINFSDLFISSSTDWTCKLWNAKTGTKYLYSFEEAADYIYDVKWCPSHPSVFATVDGTGNMDIWDLNHDTEIPLMKVTVSQKALNRLRWSADGKKILTGDSVGNLFIYDSGEISVPQSDEWAVLEETLQKMIQVDESANPQQPPQEKKE